MKTINKHTCVEAEAGGSMEFRHWPHRKASLWRPTVRPVTKFDGISSLAAPKGVIMTAHGAASDEIPSNHLASASTRVCLLTGFMQEYVLMFSRGTASPIQCIG